MGRRKLRKTESLEPRVLLSGVVAARGAAHRHPRLLAVAGLPGCGDLSPHHPHGLPDTESQAHGFKASLPPCRAKRLVASMRPKSATPYGAVFEGTGQPRGPRSPPADGCAATRSTEEPAPAGPSPPARAAAAVLAGWSDAQGVPAAAGGVGAGGARRTISSAAAMPATTALRA